MLNDAYNLQAWALVFRETINMKIKQLSLFLENKPGHLSSACQTLADAGVNILTLSMADTQQFGILRIIVRDWEKAKAALEGAGIVVNITEVLAIEIQDRPGGLAAVLKIVEQAGINVEYMYAFTYRCHEEGGVLVFRFPDPDQAVRGLTAAGVNVIGGGALFDRAES